MTTGRHEDTMAAAADSLEIRVRGRHLVLLSERAVFWREAKMLVAADPHFGKGQVFRDRGVPVPAGTTAADLERLSRLIGRLKPSALLFLGDLVHGRLAAPCAFTGEVRRWRQRHAAIRMILVTGNHDAGAGGLSAAFRLDEIVPEKAAAPFVFTHKPVPGVSGYGIAGHIHPAVTLTGKGRLKETLPCFSFGPGSALLPAFGGFTGTCAVRPGPRDRIFVIARDEVVAM